MVWSVVALMFGVLCVLCGLAWVHPGLAVAAAGGALTAWALLHDHDGGVRSR